MRQGETRTTLIIKILLCRGPPRRPGGVIGRVQWERVLEGRDDACGGGVGGEGEQPLMDAKGDT